MYKVCLMVFCYLFSFGAIGQTSVFDPQDTGITGGAINIAVSEVTVITGDGYFSEAVKLEKKGDFNEALTLFGKAAFEYNSSKNFNAYGAALLRLSNVHLLLNHYLEAEQVVLNVALKNYSRIGSRIGEMDSYSQLAKVYYSSNKLTQSLWFYTQQGILARYLKNNPAYMDSMFGIILIKIKKKEYSLALKDVNKAELFARTTKITNYNTQLKNTRRLIKERFINKK